jgi:hypothetical protein
MNLKILFILLYNTLKEHQFAHVWTTYRDIPKMKENLLWKEY